MTTPVPSEPHDQVDFVFAGAGAAGLSLAAILLERFPEARAVLVDPSLADSKNRTFAFWCAGEPPFADAVSKTWAEVEVLTDVRAITTGLDHYRYHVITGADFRDATVARLESTGRAVFVHGKALGHVEGDDHVTLETTAGPVRGAWLFDSRFDPHDVAVDPKRHVALTQRFLGWDVLTPHPAFDDTRVRLFDFRTPQDGDQRFVYVLPFTDRFALVEHVCLVDTDQAALLERYVRDVLGLRDYQILRREAGTSLLTNAPFPRAVGARTLRIGLAGGRLKASSGYAFTRIVEDARAIARSLATHGHPFDLPVSPSVFTWLDRLFLTVTRDHPERMPEIFAAMFHFNPPDRVFAFLDEAASADEIMKLGLQLPVGPFLEAAGLRFFADLKRELDASGR